MNNVVVFFFICPILFSQSYLSPRDVYNFEVGDTLEYSISSGTLFTQFQDYQTTRFTISSKNFTLDSTSVCYMVNSFSMKRTWNNSIGQHDTTYLTSSDTWCYSNLDSNLRYLPSYNNASIADTIELYNFLLQYCSPPSPIYYTDTIEDYYGLLIYSPSQVFTMSENCALQQYVKEVFRPGFGKTHSFTSFETGTYTQYTDTTLTYMVKNGVGYGLKDPSLGMQQVSPISNLQLVNNPVSKLLLLKGYFGPISILDVCGRIIYTSHLTQEGLSVEFLEKGNYYINLTKLGVIVKFYKI